MPSTIGSAPRASSRRLGHLLALTVALVLVAGACVPLVSPPTSGRTYGQGPIDAVWEAAEAQSRCAGLTSAELAAMMMVPTFPETGGPIPSPMTLGRWDNVGVNPANANLFAFAQTTGPYTHAFFTAGVGMWQFDSAGGWNLTAATAIDSVTSSRQAAATISFRYCNPPSSVARDEVSLRKYAWGPWYGCSPWSGWNCEQLYQDLYADELLDAGVDDAVGRLGGMEQRTCDVDGLGVGLTCWYVDPARAQGSTGGWRAGTYDPTRTDWFVPLPKPFYVIEHGGREYRMWLPADTGFDIGITGHKPVTANARTSLVWDRQAPLCDRTAGRGQCPSPPTTAPPTTAPPTTTPPTTTTPPATNVPVQAGRTLYLRDSSTSGIADRIVSFGRSRSSQVLVCDWDGNGTSTPGEFLGGVWTISDQPDGGGQLRTFGYGNPSGDTAVCGDWDANGSETPGVYRNGTWFLSNVVGAPVADHLLAYGDPGDVPVVGDWNGDGVDAIGVFRRGWWFLTDDIYSGVGSMVFGFGNPTGDRPVAGDWDGNGRAEPGVFRNGVWYLAASAGQPYAALAFAYGASGDIPLAGRWLGGPVTTPGVAR